MYAYDLRWTTTTPYGDPLRDVRFWVECETDAGERVQRDGVWDGGSDGGDRWLARLNLPGRAREWRYTIHSTDPAAIAGPTRGVFAPESLRPVPAPIRVSPDGRHFERDGTPFLWLGDTAWNGLLLADEPEWERYLSTRAEQGFTGVQAIMTQWRSAPTNHHGDPAYLQAPLRIVPEYFHALDRKIEAINRHGLVAALVLLWANKPWDPGNALPEADAIALARYMVDRYQADDVIWILGGDGIYLGEFADRWRRIGRAVFEGRRERLVTMHPQAVQWAAANFRDEPWSDFASYQSGHGDSAEWLSWLTSGSPAHAWRDDPAEPIVNMEPCYEGHVSYHSRTTFTAAQVRRALYWSLLVSPPAGVTYGHHSVWPWQREAGVPADHPESGEALAWFDAIDSEGARAIRPLRELLDGLPWWRLVPVTDLVLDRDPDQPERHVAAAVTDDGATALIYLPEQATARLDPGRLAAATSRTWYDPRTGQRYPADAGTASGVITPPTGEDWVLMLTW